MIKLYYSPGSCALASHIVLIWIGEAYEAVPVQYGDPEYLKINPLGAVPALIDGASAPMSQGSAILKYLADKYPQSKLGSNGDLRDSFEINHWMAFITGDLHPAYFPVFMPSRYTEKQDEESLKAVKQAGKKRVDKYLGHLDHHLEGKEHMIGDRRTVVDAYAFAISRWSMPLANWPNLKRFVNTLLQEKSVQKAMREQGLPIDS